MLFGVSGLFFVVVKCIAFVCTLLPKQASMLLKRIRVRIRRRRKKKINKH